MPGVCRGGYCESIVERDSSVHLIYHDPSDLGSLILIRCHSDMCIPVHISLAICVYNKEISSLAKGNIVDII